MSSKWGLRDYGTNANQIYFDYDPYGPPIPSVNKNIIKCTSVSSWEDDGTITPPIDSYFDESTSERGGLIVVEHDYMKLSTVLLFYAKYNQKPPINQVYTQIFNNNVKKEYRVIISDFKPSDKPIGVAENNEEVYSFRLEMINIQTLL